MDIQPSPGLNLSEFSKCVTLIFLKEFAGAIAKIFGENMVLSFSSDKMPTN